MIGSSVCNRQPSCQGRAVEAAPTTWPVPHTAWPESHRDDPIIALSAVRYGVALARATPQGHAVEAAPTGAGARQHDIR